MSTAHPGTIGHKEPVVRIHQKDWPRVGGGRQYLVGVGLFDVFLKNPDDPDDSGAVVLRQSLARVIAKGQAETVPMQRYPPHWFAKWRGRLSGAVLERR